MEPTAGRVRQMQDMRQAKENQAPLRDMCRQAQPSKRGMGQETTGEKTKLSLTLKATERKQQASKR